MRARTARLIFHRPRSLGTLPVACSSRALLDGWIGAGLSMHFKVRRCALQTRLAKERLHGLGTRVRCGGAHAGEWQMCEAPRDRGAETPQGLLLYRIELLQLFGDQPIYFGGRDVFERAAQAGQLPADGARCELIAQALE